MNETATAGGFDGTTTINLALEAAIALIGLILLIASHKPLRRLVALYTKTERQKRLDRDEQKKLVYTTLMELTELRREVSERGSSSDAAAAD